MTIKILVLICITVSPALSANCTVDLTDFDGLVSQLQNSLEVTCSASTMTVKISSCVYEQMGYDPAEDLALNGPDGIFGGMPPIKCHGNYSMSEHFVQWVISLDECDMAVETVGDMRVYKNALRTITFSNTHGLDVAFRSNIEVDVSCTYQYNLTADVGPYNATMAPITNVMAMDTGDYAETVKLCQDSACADEITPNSFVTVLDNIYVVVEVDYGALVVQFVRVWATPTPEAGDGTFYSLIAGGCLEYDQFQVHHYSGTTGWLLFPAFYWFLNENAQIYIHVEYDLCDQDVHGLDCFAEPTCDRRRKRNIFESSTHLKLRSKTIGPIVVKS